MYIPINTTYLLLFLLLSPFISSGKDIVEAQPAYTFLHYSEENGLPQNSVRNLYTDNSGYLWFSTQSGLVRFDGRNFKVFNSSILPGARSDRIRWTGLGPTGRVYCMDEFNDFYCQIRPTLFRKIVAGKNKVFLADLQTTDIYPVDTTSIEVSNMLADVAQQKRILAMRDGSAYYFYTSKHKEGVLVRIKKNRVTELVRSTDDESSLFMNFSDTLCLVNPANRGLIIHGNKFISNVTKSGAHDFNYSQGQVLSSSGLNYQIENRDIYELFLATDLSIKKRLILSGVPARSITSVFKIPKTGIYAVGTFNDGLYLFHKRNFNRIFVNNDSDFKNIAYSISQVGDEILAGQFLYNLRSRKIQPHNKKITSKFSYRDKKGFLWLLENQWGGFKLSKSKNLKSHSAVVGSVNEEIIGMAETDLSGNNFVFITPSQIGLVHDNKLEIIFDSQKFFSKLININSMYLTGSDLLLGTTNGIYRFDIKSRNISMYKNTGGNNVRAFYMDHDKNMWIGTYGQGFFLFKGDSLIAIPLDKSKNVLVVNCIVEDRNGIFWLTTNSGLFSTSRKQILKYLAAGRLGKETVNYYEYAQNDGIPLRYEFNGGCTPCSLKVDSTLYLPSLKGIIAFVPEIVSTYSLNNEVQLDAIEIDGKIKYSDDLIRLPNNFGVFSMNVSIPYFGAKENIHLEYRVDGLDGDWRPLEDGRIQFLSLRTGDYRIDVRTYALVGDAVPSVISIPFSVTPSFFETPVFLFIVLIILVAFVWLFIKVRYRLILSRNALLAREVRDRTKQQEFLIEELQDKNLNLRNSEENLYRSISEKERLVAVIIHDLRSPIRFLYENISMINKNIDKYDREKLKYLLSGANDTTAQIHLLTEELMIWISTNQNKYKSTLGKYELAGVVGELAEMYENIIAQNNNVFSVEVPGINIYTDKIILKTLIRNVVDNANKNTQDGTINISATKLKSSIKVVISDSGVGMPAQMMQAMNAYFRGDTDSFNNGIQFGHKILRDFSLLLNSTLQYRENPGGGTRVILTLNI